MSDCSTVLKELKRHGLLLQQDKTLPSVVGLITGESLSSSWWSHPKAQQIFACLSKIADREDVLMTRLIAKKVTWVHQRLWPAFLAVATARERWQTRGLSTAARQILRRVESDNLVEASGPAVRELQERMLVDSIEI